MKKIYLLFTLLLSVLCSTATYAQAEEGVEFSKLQTIQLGPALGEFATETWYFMYQGRPYNTDGAIEQLVGAGDLPATDGGVMADVGAGENVMKKSWHDVENPAAVMQYAGYLVRFLPVEGKDGTYVIQFGTGNFMGQPTGTNNGSNFKSAESIYDAGNFNIYTIDEAQPGYFGFNVDEYAQRIDNNGTGTALVAWGTGKRTAVEAGNSIWSIHEVVWGEADELEALYDELTDLVDQYESEANSFQEMTGTQVGQYDSEAVAALLTALEYDYALLDVTYVATIEELTEAIKVLKEAYQAVIASKVPYTLADGYYRIRAAMVYTNEVETGEVDENQNPITESAERVKYMYTESSGGTIAARWRTPEDLSSDAPALWKITNKEQAFDIVNVATDARFNNVQTSQAVTLSTEAENLMVFDNVFTTTEGETYLNIRVSTQAAGNFFYLHQNGHGGGTGTEGTIVGWESTLNNGTPAASEWVLEPVSAEDAAAIIAAYAPVQEHQRFINEYKSLQAEAAAALEAAKDVQTINLITDNSQFSSPWTETSEGSINNLLDGDPTTFWHSAWSAGQVEAHVHYLQVALNEPVHELISITFARRKGATNDHLTRLSVYGSEAPDTDDEAWVELAAFDTPFTNQDQVVTTDPFDTQGCQYLRFYEEATTNNRGYWHVGEFQLSYQQENPNSQYSTLGQIAVNLDKVLADQAGVADADITQELYDALKAAYDAFKGSFVDPAELRGVLAEVKGKADIIVTGNNPGFWKDDNTAKALKKTIEEATAYDAAGNYTAAESKRYIETLRQQAAAIDAAAIGIQEGKWYRIRFGSEEAFTEHGWDLVAGNYATTQEYEGSTYEINEPIWDKYITVANSENRTLVEGHVTAIDITPVEADQALAIGQRLYVDADEDIADKALAQFRFVAVSDSAYVLQNKATGLFIKCGTTGATTLSVHPSLFTVKPIGYGFNLLAAKSLSGETQNYLHIQNNGNTVVTWDAFALGSRSALYIEEVGDVESNYDGTAFNINLQPASVSAFCFPTDISAANGIYGVNAAEAGEDGQIALTLVPLQRVAAGRPFIAIPAAGEDYDADAEEEPAAFTHGYSFVAQPLETPVIHGVFAEQTVGYGVIVPEEGGFVVTKRSDAKVGANHAYIANTAKFDREATAVFTIDAQAEDGIAAALDKVAKSGAIYTIDGRLVTKNGNLNSLQRMGKGIYIVNGIKVTVK